MRHLLQIQRLRLAIAVDAGGVEARHTGAVADEEGGVFRLAKSGYAARESDARTLNTVLFLSELIAPYESD
jgi:hypothetical protein